MSEVKKVGFFARHAKSSAMLVSLIIHAALIMVALTAVVFTHINKKEQTFEVKEVKRPKMKLRKLKVPVKVQKKSRPKPKVRKVIVAKQVKRSIPEFVMPEVASVGGSGGFGAGGDGDGTGGIGFSLPEINFFGTKGKGEKVVFCVHFGHATVINQVSEGVYVKNPYTRMTGYILRKRLQEMVNGLPSSILFNVAAYWVSDTDAMSPTLLAASQKNKDLLADWMSTVNPLEGDYEHCFKRPGNLTASAKLTWPTRVNNLPFYSEKWVYPYEVPDHINGKFLPDAEKGFVHWGRAVVWAMLTQKPDVIFILTTNYVDGYGSWKTGDPVKTTQALLRICRSIYGKDRKRYPKINVVVLGKDSENDGAAQKRLDNFYAPLFKAFKGEGNVIDDLSKYMTSQEQAQMDRYRSQYKQ